jgi:hypothetical protein
MPTTKEKQMPGYTIEYGNGLYESVWLPTREDWTPEMYSAELDRIETETRAEMNRKSWFTRMKEKLCRRKK